VERQVFNLQSRPQGCGV
jgi:hypothetical protein